MDVDADVAVDAESQDGTKGDPSAQRGYNRRKSNAPTRCAKKDETMVVGSDSEEKTGEAQVAQDLHLPHAASVVQVGLVNGAQIIAIAPPEGDRGDGAPGEGEKRGTGALNFPQIASLLLAAKEQAEGDEDDDDDSSENELIINGDAEEEGEENNEEGEEEDDDDEGEGEEKECADAADAGNDNDHNHNNVSRGEEEGEEEGESCGSVPSPSSDAADGGVVLDAGREVMMVEECISVRA